MTQRDYEIAVKLKEKLSGITRLCDFRLCDFRLYGSRARGDGDEDSDMDVFLEVPHKTKI